jgi:hypothetical protein
MLRVTGAKKISMATPEERSNHSYGNGTSKNIPRCSKEADTLPGYPT